MRLEIVCFFLNFNFFLVFCLLFFLQTVYHNLYNSAHEFHSTSFIQILILWFDDYGLIQSKFKFSTLFLKIRPLTVLSAISRSNLLILWIRLGIHFFSLFAKYISHESLVKSIILCYNCDSVEFISIILHSFIYPQCWKLTLFDFEWLTGIGENNSISMSSFFKFVKFTFVISNPASFNSHLIFF